MKDTMIRFRDGSIGMNNTCSRYTPTSPMLILLICSSTALISGKEHIWIKSSRTKDWRKGTTDKLQIDDRSTSVTKGRIRNPEGTTENPTTRIPGLEERDESGFKTRRGERRLAEG